MAVKFFSETSKFEFRNKRKTSLWLSKVITNNYSRVTGEICFIFCSDEQLLEINQKYLKHFYYTDVITFNYNDDKVINGDIYISIDRISENAVKYNETFERELFRVMVHGILHLLGYNDKTSEQKRRMRELENLHLNEINF